MVLVDMPWIGNAKAVLEAYLGGQALGGAIADLLFGDANPCGKLAETFPARLEDTSSYLFYFGEEDRVEYKEGVFVGYRYYDKKKIEPLFPFGHGLSYTSFTYSALTFANKSIRDDETLDVQVTVKIQEIEPAKKSFSFMCAKPAAGSFVRKKS